MVDAPTGPWETPAEGGLAAAIAKEVPPDAAPAVRVVLLRSVTESDLGTGNSLPGHVRAWLARNGARPDPEFVALELALLDRGLDFAPGVALATMRLPLLDPIAHDLERLDANAATRRLRDSVARMIERLSSDALGPTREARHSPSGSRQLPESRRRPPRASRL